MQQFTLDSMFSSMGLPSVSGSSDKESNELCACGCGELVNPSGEVHALRNMRAVDLTCWNLLSEEEKLVLELKNKK